MAKIEFTVDWHNDNFVAMTSDEQVSAMYVSTPENIRKFRKQLCHPFGPRPKTLAELTKTVQSSGIPISIAVGPGPKFVEGEDDE